MISALNILIRMVIVVGILLMLAFDKYPKNDYLSQQNFLFALIIFAFLYHFAQLSRAPVVKPTVDVVLSEETN